MDWENIRHFKKSEFGTLDELDHTDPLLVWLLDCWREAIKKRIVIHECFAISGHSKNSWHYKGKACDFHLSNLNGSSVPLYEQLWLALTFSAWQGIGIYPYWNNPGLHVDLRKSDMIKIWIRDKNGKYRNAGKGIIDKGKLT